MTDRLYPLFLKLEGHRVLVVGGGVIAARKTESLLACGARVTLVAPKIVQALEKQTESGRIDWLARAFEPGDVAGARLIVSATDSREVNETVAACARAAGVWINTVDVPDLCDFYVPAMVDRAPLQIAISTGGAAPALARRIRAELEARFPESLGGYVALLGRLREKVKKINPLHVREAAEKLAASSAGTLWEQDAREAAERQLEREISEFIEKDDASS